MAKKYTFTSKVLKFISGQLFFKIIIGFFILQAVWIALASKYPMAFDEGYHFGIIKLYAHHPSPFWADQPENSNAFGAVFRDPSYLYHYLFSWPYRLIALFTSSLGAQVILLRLMNVALFTGGLFIYKKLLGAMGASNALSNTLILIFTLIPVTSLLAGQINYDNLLIPITGLLMLWTITFISDLRDKKTLNPWLLHKIFLLGMFGILVKYAFLPFFAAALITMSIYTIVKYKKDVKGFLGDFKREMVKVSTLKRVSMLVLTLIIILLAVERYGVNYVRYHALVPDCDQALSIRECSEFGPWIRDFDLANSQNHIVVPGPLTYFQHEWLYGMWFRLFFAVSGPGNDYQTKGPLTLPALTFISLSLAGFLAAVIAGLSILKKRTYKVAIPVGLSLFYILILFANGYGSYKETGKAVAINGRYLLPVLLPLMALGGMSLSALLKSDKIKLAAVSISILGMLIGGGAVTYIVRSENSWYWNNSLITSVGGGMRDALSPITPGSKEPIQYLR